MSKVETPWLAGWQEIATYLRVSIRTAQRWAKDDNLPVAHKMRGCPKAHKNDLDVWVRHGAPPERMNSATERQGANNR